ncbi:MAG TPA: iron-sulfur cluster assembly scaffold protein [Kiritimatiellia bacterium]|mgnify:FL=1|nr:iron-sulfur cluster assembly scaffold protein [Kiritimatiellia bacterium]HPR67897.1 iron-sulfur cluster assembly scaffold protein [Kiritimatiellia bacterium]HRX05527.1 iron-sulfur cluster assembly scaffold protein [Kiritimatiellia bacterium]
MAWQYSEKTKRIFMDAVQGKPGTHLGEIEDADGVGQHGSIVCGDALKFTFRVKKDPDPLKDVITEAKYLTFGCTSAIAASEALCALIEGHNLTPVQALQIKNQDIVDFLEGLPQQKIHCSVMGAEALEAAVVDWAQKRGVDLAALGVKLTGESADDDGRVVCKCFGVTEPYLRRKIKELNLRTIDDIVSALKAGGMCGACRYAPGGLQDILNETWGTGEPAPTTVAAEPVAEEGMSPFQRYRKIEKVIDETVRPVLKGDGGDIELVDIKDWTVYCGLRGACAGCMGASRTLQLIVERTLKDQVDERIRVVPV